MMAALTPHLQSTAEGVVSISYSTLVSFPLSLSHAIGEIPTFPYVTILIGPLEEAFGSHSRSLGIIIVQDLPSAYVGYRERLLRLAHRFATLDENIRERYADPSSRYRYDILIVKQTINLYYHLMPKLRVVVRKGL